jgi:hypothetical protein
VISRAEALAACRGTSHSAHVMEKVFVRYARMVVEVEQATGEGGLDDTSENFGPLVAVVVAAGCDPGRAFVITSWLAEDVAVVEVDQGQQTQMPQAQA